jgi:hypothetical protein
MDNKTLILVVANIATVFFTFTLFVSLHDTKQIIIDKNNEIQRLESQAIMNNSMLKINEDKFKDNLSFLVDSLVELDDVFSRYDTLVRDYCQIYTTQRPIFEGRMSIIARDYQSLGEVILQKVKDIKSYLLID